MTAAQQPAKHATIQVERVYSHPVSAVFGCWSDGEARRKWEPTPEGMEMEYEGSYEFEVGFVERSRALKDGQELAAFETRFVDIVPEVRIVSVVRVDANDMTVSASQHTIEFFSEGGGTRLKCTEQVAWLHGLDMQGEHEGGWGTLLDRLGEVLDGKR